MVERSEPVKFTFKELEWLYRHGRITYKQLQLYKHKPELIPAKKYNPIVIEDTTTKHFEEVDPNDSSTKTY